VAWPEVLKDTAKFLDDRACTGEKPDLDGIEQGHVLWEIVRGSTISQARWRDEYTWRHSSVTAKQLHVSS